MNNGKVICIDVGGVFFPCVFAWERQMLNKIATNSQQFILPAHCSYFNSVISSLKKVGVDKEKDIIILALEGKSWRKNFASYYKSDRLKQKEAHKLINWEKEYANLNKVNEAINEATNFHLVRQWQSEADDVIAVSSRYFKEKNKKVVIISGDKDLSQLAYYENVLIFNINKKCKGSKGVYELVPKPLKIIADKAKNGDIGDGIVPDKLNDTDEDYKLRYFLVNLLQIPNEIEDSIVDILKTLPKKEFHLEKLPTFKNCKEKFLEIYNLTHKITPEYCYALLDKRTAKKEKIKRLKKDEKNVK